MTDDRAALAALLDDYYVARHSQDAERLASIVTAILALPPDPERLRAFFAAHGWDIHMDDRPGQPTDPFAAIIAAWEAET